MNYLLGKFIRKKYSDFLDKQFNQRTYRAISSGTDSTIVSA